MTKIIRGRKALPALLILASALVLGPAAAAASGGNRFEASFATTPVSVTPDLGMVEVILTGSGTVNGLGSATEVVGLIQDHAVTPCGTGSWADQALSRISVPGEGLLIMMVSGAACPTPSGLQVTASYAVDGASSTGIFAGATGSGQVTVDVTTRQETYSGKLKLSSRSN